MRRAPNSKLVPILTILDPKAFRLIFLSCKSILLKYQQLIDSPCKRLLLHPNFPNMLPLAWGNQFPWKSRQFQNLFHTRIKKPSDWRQGSSWNWKIATAIRNKFFLVLVKTPWNLRIFQKALNSIQWKISFRFLPLVIDPFLRLLHIFFSQLGSFEKMNPACLGDLQQTIALPGVRTWPCSCRSLLNSFSRYRAAKARRENRLKAPIYDLEPPSFEQFHWLIQLDISIFSAWPPVYSKPWHTAKIWPWAIQSMWWKHSVEHLFLKGKCWATKKNHHRS